jgi:hypothetical protein
MRRQDPQRSVMLLLVVILGWVVLSHAHQDPCHRLHSCPSDHDTYICGDRGRCDQCPDNQLSVTKICGMRSGEAIAAHRELNAIAP